MSIIEIGKWVFGLASLFFLIQAVMCTHCAIMQITKDGQYKLLLESLQGYQTIYPWKKVWLKFFACLFVFVVCNGWVTFS